VNHKVENATLKIFSVTEASLFCRNARLSPDATPADVNLGKIPHAALYEKHEDSKLKLKVSGYCEPVLPPAPRQYLRCNICRYSLLVRLLAMEILARVADTIILWLLNAGIRTDPGGGDPLT